jgi:hypothetical protein
MASEKLRGRGRYGHQSRGSRVRVPLASTGIAGQAVVLSPRPAPASPMAASTRRGSTSSPAGSTESRLSFYPPDSVVTGRDESGSVGGVEALFPLSTQGNRQFPELIGRVRKASEFIQRVAVQILLRGRPEIGHDMPAMTGRRPVLLASCVRLRRRDFASPPVVVGVTIGTTNVCAPVPWPVGQRLPLSQGKQRLKVGAASQMAQVSVNWLLAGGQPRALAADVCDRRRPSTGGLR